MRVFGLIFVLASLAAANAPQQNTPAKSPAKPKPAAAKQAADKKTATASKPSTKTSAVSTGKPKKAEPKINNPIAPNPVAKQTKEPASGDQPVPDDAAAEAAFTKIGEITDGTERLAALRKFVRKYPKSKRTGEAAASLVAIGTQLGNDKLAAGDVPGAFELFRRAVADAPAPVPDELFNETLAKIPVNLYFRGGRTEGFDIAKAIERKSSASVPQLLSVATFYLNVENGSEARRVVEAALKVNPESPAAYQMLGLANRMDFQLEESAQAYAKALELDPESTAAKRGLSEMKRAVGKADEAVALYREIVAKDENDLPSRTGLVLAMYDAGMRAEADAELAKTLELNPGNVILLAGASYWMAAHGEGQRSIELAEKAISTDPRFIWSHIALARGYTADRNPVAAERTLIAARRYGNFPTLEFEIARARVAAGFFREAAEELAKSFSVKDGEVKTNLGGRISRSSKDFNELVGYERRASIFAPTSGDTEETSARMIALLELKQELDKPTPDADKAAKAAEDFAAGDDKMRVHRIVFAGTQLLDKKIAPQKVAEMAKAAPSFVDPGLDAPDAAAAVLASELYESRSLAAAKGEFINVPTVPRTTLSAVLRGRVEEMNGWAQMQLENPAQASVHLKRAVSVLPADTAWWRSSTWRLGNALVSEGKLPEALEIYIRNYKSSPPDALRYGVIEALYRQVNNGSIEGLERRIGPDPSATASAAPASTVASAFPRPRPTPGVPSSLVRTEPTPTTTTDKPDAETSATPSPSPEPSKASEPTPTPEEKPSPTATPIERKTVAAAVKPVDTPQPTPEPTVEPTPEPSATPESTPAAAEPTPEPTPKATRSVEPPVTAVAKETSGKRLTDNSNGMFPPVVITIPPPPKVVTRKSGDTAATPKPTPVAEEPLETKNEDPADKPEVKIVPADGRPRVAGKKGDTGVPPCTLTLDQDAVTVQSTGNERAVVVRRTDDGDIEGITGSSTSAGDVSIRREELPGVKWTALFVLKSVSGKPGLFQVVFETPCGRKEVPVRVQ